MPIGIIASISSNFLTKSEGIYATVNNIELVFVIICFLYSEKKIRILRYMDINNVRKFSYNY